MHDVLPKLIAAIILAPLAIGVFAALVWWWRRGPGRFGFGFFDGLFKRLSKNKDQ